MKAAAPTEVPGLNGVLEYRGVRFDHREGAGEWVTWSQIVENTKLADGRQIRGTTRISARSQTQLLRKIDQHLDAGGEIAWS